MRNPTEPPGPPPEPFPLTRTPPSGTLLGLPPPLPPVPPPAELPARLALAPQPPAELPELPAAELERRLERHVDGMRVELVYFRQWWAREVLTRRAELLAVPPRPPRPPVPPPAAPGARLRALQRRALALGAASALAMLVALASGAAALSWPAYGRLVARVTYVGAAPQASPER